MKHNNILLLSCSVVTLFMLSCGDISREKHVYSTPSSGLDHQKNSGTKEIAVAAPPFSEGIFPCSECHEEMDKNSERRELFMHDEVSESFDHDSENRWCLDCHDLTYRDSLKLASGKRLDFKESYKLCGQCHGDKYRDWKVGVHGKRTGEWNGKKQYLLCVHCHNPHSPKFSKIKPLPPPVRQKDIN